MVYTSEYPFVYLCADVATFSLRPEEGLCVLLVRRREAPYKGRWALPGGFVGEGEDVEKAARRELTEETGVRVGSKPFRRLDTYAAPRRDPRHRTVSISYWAVVGPETQAQAGEDAADVRWWPAAEALESKRLAFDHATILADATEALGAAMEATTVATAFLGEEFTIAQLRGVYEAVWGRALDPGNFQRKALSTPGFVVDSGWRTAGSRGRPATLFTAGEGGEVWPPMSRTRDR